MIFFSSDWHFNHTNICGPSLSRWKDGFRNFSSLHEMNERIIDEINSAIKPNDILYFLGDFAFGDKSKIPSLRNRIRCKTIHLIYGNHDEALKESYTSSFTSCQDYLEIFYKKKRFCLFHYPIGSWHKIGRGRSYQPFGHCHGTYSRALPGQLDVGVDCWDFKPISIEQYMDACGDISRVGYDNLDHHTKGKVNAKEN